MSLTYASHAAGLRRSAIERAIDRDIIDAERLAHFAETVANAIDALATDAHALGHPNRRWHPGDLLDDLQGHLKAIRFEQQRLTQPLVLDDDDE